MPPAHASRLAATWDRTGGQPWRMIDGSAVLADLSGFTRLTEVLTSTGAEGVEVLHRALTICFGALLGHSLELEGDVIGFAGDAALVWFEGDHHAERAARAAAAMPADLAAVPAALTGRSRLRASVGVHTGQFLAVRASARDQPGPFLCGPEVSMLARLEAAAEPMQVLMSSATADALPRNWSGGDASPGIVLDRRRARAARSPRIVTASATIGGTAPLEERVPDGEHRDASIGFVLVPGLDHLLVTDGPGAVHERLAHVVDVVTRVVDDLAMTWLDCDVGVDSVKLLLTAGVPRALDDDDGRLLAGMRRIVDECRVPVRAGAQRGRVFAGLFGVRGRRTFTVFGDPVNVAARALGKAVDGELVVGDGLRVEGRDWVVAEAMGPQQLKNRARPMEMWRIRSTAERPSRPTPRTGHAALCRRRERRQLADAWKRTTDGAGISVELVSEPGMGAAELVADLVDLAGGSATPIVADRFRRHVPYSGTASLVRALARTAGVELADDGWSWLATFAAQLPPTLRAWAPDALTVATGGATSLPDPLTASRRSRQVLAALVSLAAPAPWLLAVEDADQLDDASQQVIDALRALTERTRLMLVTTIEQAGSRSAGRPPDVSIVLEPLDRDAAEQFVLELAPELRHDRLARIIAAGGGNPFVMAELLAHADTTALPDSLQRLGASLVDSLAPEVRSAVLDASVLGMELDPTVLASVLGRPEFASPTALEHADRVLRRGEGSTWRFRHEAFRRAAYETLTFERRRTLHSAIADHLRAHRPAGVSAGDALVALHLEASGREQEAYPLAIAAARTAKASGALPEAVDLLDRAARMARRLDPGSCGALLLDLGEARLWTGDVDGAAAAYASSARHLTDPLHYARMCHLRADLALRRNRQQQARRWIGTGTSIVAPLGDRAVHAQVNLTLLDAVLLDMRGRRAPALQRARQALAEAERAGLMPLIGLAHLQLEGILSGMMLPEAVEHGDAATRIFESIGDDRLLERALNNSGLTAMYLGRWDDALVRYERARVHAERCGHAVDGAFVELNTGFLQLRRNRLDDADGLARRAHRVFASAQHDHGTAMATLLRAMVAAAGGDHTIAHDLLATARAGFERIDEAPMVVDCDVVLMDLLRLQGRHDEVVALAPTIEPRLALAEPEVAVTFDRVLGSARAAAGDRGGAERIERALARAREQHLLYEVHLALGALAEVAGDDAGSAERDELARTLGIVTR